MVRWIYKVLDHWEDCEEWHWTDHLYAGEEAEKVLNTMGSEGWELVSVIPLSWPDSNQEPGQTTNIQYTFKKPVSEI